MMPVAMPRRRRGHHWLIRLMAGAQQAALTKPVMAQGMAISRADVPKDAAQLKTVVRMAPRATQSRSPYASAMRPVHEVAEHETPQQHGVDDADFDVRKGEVFLDEGRRGPEVEATGVDKEVEHAEGDEHLPPPAVVSSRQLVEGQRGVGVVPGNRQGGFGRRWRAVRRGHRGVVDGRGRWAG